MAKLSFGIAEVNAEKLRDIAGGYAYMLSEEIRQDIALHQIHPDKNYEEMGRKNVLNLQNKMKWYLEACEEAHALYEALKEGSTRKLVFEEE